jgi:hypothetical protein
VNQFTSVNLGSSWGLTLTCWIISWFIIYYYKTAIEYRRNGDPVTILTQAPVAQVVLMQQPAGTVMIQQPSPVVMMGSPAVMVAQTQVSLEGET